MLHDFAPDPPDHIATGLESLREFAENAGADRPDHQWLLDDRDVWVRNPHYTGPDQGHPEDDHGDEPDQFRTDAEADGDALASAGMGTDEDYGSCGDEVPF